MTRRALTALVVAAGVLGLAAPAHAAYFPSEVVDGPSPDIVGLANLDVSRDGTGWAGYVKREGGFQHLFASRLDKGSPQPPQRVDVGQLTDSTSPRLAVANDHRAMAVWVNGGALWASERPGRNKPWGAPTQIYANPALVPVTDPQLDVTLFGTAFVSFTVGTDVWVARKRYNGNWQVLPAPVDIDPARIAADSDVAAAGDGSAIVAWTETGLDAVSHVFTRRITLKGQLSAVPREASVPRFRGRPGGSADSPSVTIQDDSSYAFVAFRQDFTDAERTVSRALGRRLVASSYEPVRGLDGTGFSSPQGAASSQIFAASRGEGIAATVMRGGPVIGRGIGRKGLGYEARWFGPRRLGGDSLTAPPPMTATTTDGAVGVVAWEEGGNLLGARWEMTKFDRTRTIASGGVNGDFGVDSGGDTRTDYVLGYVREVPGGRQVEALSYVGPLRPAGLHTDTGWFRKRRLLLDWTALTNVVWGPVTYRVYIDGALAATTRKSAYRPTFSNGVHTIRIDQVDGRGQVSRGFERTRAIDATKPSVSVRRVRRGYRIYASDGTSGVEWVRLEFGSRHATVNDSGGAVRGTFVSGRGASRVIARDEAGNTTTRSL
jgi:hypothetical protein